MFDSCLHNSMLAPLTTAQYAAGFGISFALISLRTLLTASSYLIFNHLN